MIEGPPIRYTALDDKVRPTVGGYMISVAAGWFADARQLGVNMQYNGALSIVTNNHVIAKNGNVGSSVYQPDTGTSKRTKSPPSADTSRSSTTTTRTKRIR